MTEKKAIKFIRDLQFRCTLLFGTATNKAKEQLNREYQALNLACEALEKQIPKKIEKKKMEKNIKEKLYTIAFCPVCKGSVWQIKTEKLQIKSEYKFCPYCGQALDWSEQECE